MIGQDYITSSGFSAQSSVARNSVISAKTSDKTFKSIGGGMGGSATTGSSYSVKGTLSSTSIHKEVRHTVTYSPGHTYKAYNPVEVATQALYTEQPSGPRRSRGENPGGPAVGDASVPAGDMLLPLLVMAAAYMIVKLFRNHKTSHTL